MKLDIVELPAADIRIVFPYDGIYINEPLKIVYYKDAYISFDGLPSKEKQVCIRYEGFGKDGILGFRANRYPSIRFKDEYFLLKYSGETMNNGLNRLFNILGEPALKFNDPELLSLSGKTDEFLSFIQPLIADYTPGRNKIEELNLLFLSARAKNLEPVPPSLQLSGKQFFDSVRNSLLTITNPGLTGIRRKAEAYGRKLAGKTGEKVTFKIKDGRVEFHIIQDFSNL